MSTTILSIVERLEKVIQRYNSFYKRAESASAEQLQQLQDKLTYQLPKSFIEFYKINNGLTDMRLFLYLYTLDEMLNPDFGDDYEDILEKIEYFHEDDQAVEGITKADFKNLKALKPDNCLIFGDDGDQYTFFINFSKPFLDGEYQIVAVSYEDLILVWKSFPEFLIAQAENFEKIANL